MIASAISARRRLRLRAGVLTACLWLGCSLPAGAAWKSTPTPPELPVSSATLEPPGDLSALNGECIAGISININLSWSPTPSEFAQGYEALRSTTPGGPYTKIGAVSGLNTTTFIDTNALFATTYYYVIRATKNNWRSVASGESSVTTLAPLCS